MSRINYYIKKEKIMLRKFLKKIKHFLNNL